MHVTQKNIARRAWLVLGTAACACVVTASSAAAHMTCDRYPFDDSAQLAQLFDRVSDTVAAFSGLSGTLNSDLTFCLSDALLTERGYFQPEGRQIVLAEGLPPGLEMAVAVHELRHAEQFETGNCPNLTLSMKDYAEGVFAMEADASVTSLVVAAYWRENGKPAMWDALAAWPMQADVAARFDATLAKSSDVGLAATHAFEAWYENQERRRSYYIAACSNYLDFMDDAHALPQYGSLAEGYFAALCRLPDGRAYACRRPSDPS